MKQNPNKITLKVRLFSMLADIQNMHDKVNYILTNIQQEQMSWEFKIGLVTSILSLTRLP